MKDEIESLNSHKMYNRKLLNLQNVIEPSFDVSVPCFIISIFKPIYIFKSICLRNST